MNDHEKRLPLLGWLAQTGWIRRHGEVLATHALSYLLEDREVGDAFSNLLSERSGAALPSGLSYQPEITQPDKGRVDLAADSLVATGESARVKIEAKFGARLSVPQLSSYANDLGSDVPHAKCILAVIAPGHRLAEARNCLAEAAGVTPAAAAISFSSGVRGLALSWSDVFDALEDAAQDADVGHDLRQLKAMAATFAGLDPPPFTKDDLGAGWRSRRNDFEILIDRLTERWTNTDRIYPLGQDHDFERRRYVCDRNRHNSCWAVGVLRGPLELGDHECALAFRYHKDSDGFEDAVKRLDASPLSPTVEHSNGHVFIPLLSQLDVGFEAVLDDLDRQLSHIVDVIWPGYQAPRRN